MSHYKNSINFSTKIKQYYFYLLIVLLLFDTTYASDANEHINDEEHQIHDSVHEISLSEKWSYSILAGILMGVISFLCSLAVVLLKNKFRLHFLIHILIAAGAGALIGDAGTHLISEGFGAHSHGEHEHTEAVDIEE